MILKKIFHKIYIIFDKLIFYLMKRRLLGKKYAFNNIKANEFSLST
jgi:hypothetical protein